MRNQVGEPKPNSITYLHIKMGMMRPGGGLQETQGVAPQQPTPASCFAENTTICLLPASLVPSQD